jgi:hypothetical protein
MESNRTDKRIVTFDYPAVDADSVSVCRAKAAEPFRYLGGANWRCPACDRLNTIGIRCNALDPLPVSCVCGKDWALVFP